MARVLTDAATLPWETRADSVLWSSKDSPLRVVFDAAGIKGWQDGAMFAEHPWGRVRDLALRVPYSSRRTVAALSVWDLISPKPVEFSSTEVGISFTAGFDVVQWTLVTEERYDWRLQFILDDLTRLLEQDFSPLARPGLLDDVVRRVATHIRPYSRLLLYTDLLGLDRYLGGHTAYDSAIRALLDHPDFR